MRNLHKQKDNSITSSLKNLMWTSENDWNKRLPVWYCSWSFLKGPYALSCVPGRSGGGSYRNNSSRFFLSPVITNWGEGGWEAALEGLFPPVWGATWSGVMALPEVLTSSFVLITGWSPYRWHLFYFLKCSDRKEEMVSKGCCEYFS